MWGVILGEAVRRLPWRSLLGGLLIMLVAGAAVGWHRRAVARAHAAGVAAGMAGEAARQKAMADAAAARVRADDARTAAAMARQALGDRRAADAVRARYRDRPDPVCLDADGVRIVRDADDARAAAGAADDGAPAL